MPRNLWPILVATTLALSACDQLESVQITLPTEASTVSESLAPGEQPSSGEFFRVGSNGTIYFVWANRYYGIPSAATFAACFGSPWNAVHSLSSFPSTLTHGGTLPDAQTETWLSEQGPVQAANSGTVYVIRGCVKAGISTWSRFTELFGARGKIRTVSTSLWSLPDSRIVDFPLLPYGTYIKKPNDPTVRRVVGPGVSLGVPSGTVLASHCGYAVSQVPASTFDAYGWGEVLHAAPGGCGRTIPALTVIPQLQIPLPQGHAWLLSVETATQTTSCSGGWGGRYYGGGYDCYHSGRDKYALDFPPKREDQNTGGTVVESDVAVLAAADGTVAWVGWDASGGNCIRVDHMSGISTLYCHLKDRGIVSQGQTVSAEQRIGTMGNTGGNTTGTHLHFSVRYGGEGAGASSDPILQEIIVDHRRLSEYRVGYPGSLFYWATAVH